MALAGNAEENAMAISDTLSQAVDEMRAYVRNQPAMYADFQPQLNKLIEEMETMRIALDRPPTNDPTGPLASAYDAAYGAALADTSKLQER